MEILSHMRPWPFLQSPAACQTQSPFGLYLAVSERAFSARFTGFGGFCVLTIGSEALESAAWHPGLESGRRRCDIRGVANEWPQEKLLCFSAHRLPILVCDVFPSIATQLVGATVFRIKSLETRCRLPGLCGSRRDCWGVCCMWFPQRTVTSKMPKVVSRCKRGGQGCGKREKGRL